MSVAECFRQHASAYLDKFGDRVPLGHRKVISAITRCRTGELGNVIYACDGCGQAHWVGRSCGNRHCPTCQHGKTVTWLTKQTQRLLPIHHFLITFTVPQELRIVLRAHQKDGYDAIFVAGSQTIRKLANNPKWLGTRKIGFFGVLQTWGRDPTVYHPHVHFIVPGGGVSEDGTKWLATPENFFFPEPCASPIYRAKFRDLMCEAGLDKLVDPSIWRHDKWWEVDVKPVGNGQAVLKYLAPYVFRVAIGDNRIESCDEQTVTFRYTPSKSKKSKTRPVAGNEFIRGFLQHVLPSGYQKIRYYGWMSQNHRMAIDRVRWLVWLYLGWTFWLASLPVNPPIVREPVGCARCGNTMRLVAVLDHDDTVLYGHALDYLDSG
jgi:hypothetical protein